MKDVLESLKKLPPVCAAVIGDQAVFIRRGAAEAAPAHMKRSLVDAWNRERNITWPQIQAMIIGVTLGWDKDGADPDTHGEGGPFEWVFTATLAKEIQVMAHTEEEAIRLAHEQLDRPIWDQITLESLDLIEGRA